MISLTTPLAPQQLHALGRQDEQGQAEPMRETAAATCVQCCAHRHPAADCDKLGGSGACPAWCVKGERHTQTLPICSVQQQLSKPACLLPAGKPATSQHPWKERRGEGGWTGQSCSIPKGQPNSDHSHLGWDTDTAALLLAVMQCLENTSPKVDCPHPAGVGKAEIHVALQHWRLFLSLKVHQLW